MTMPRPAKKKSSPKMSRNKAACSTCYDPNKGAKKTVGNKVSRIKVKYDVGFNNNLYIRGNGPGLSWEQGALMKNVGPDEWVWETSQPFSDCEFKVLINDECFEGGDNHRLSKGGTVQYTPYF
jgi:hypothetical protein